jgi:ribosomal protein L37AE/L43A
MAERCAAWVLSREKSTLVIGPKSQARLAEANSKTEGIEPLRTPPLNAATGGPDMASCEAPPRQAVDLAHVNGGTENMIASQRGSKHLCPECASKYYDLNKEVVTCPKCGAKPLAAKLLKAVRPVRKTGRTAFGRFP